MEPVALCLSLIRDERGSTATEYALLASVATIFAIGGLSIFASDLVKLWDYVSTTVVAALSG